MPISHFKRLRHREVRSLAQGHTARKWLSWDSNLKAGNERSQRPPNNELIFTPTRVGLTELKVWVDRNEEAPYFHDMWEKKISRVYGMHHLCKKRKMYSMQPLRKGTRETGSCFQFVGVELDGRVGGRIITLCTLSSFVLWLQSKNKTENLEIMLMVI